MAGLAGLASLAGLAGQAGLTGLIGRTGLNSQAGLPGLVGLAGHAALADLTGLYDLAVLSGQTAKIEKPKLRNQCTMAAKNRGTRELVPRKFFIGKFCSAGNFTENSRITLQEI